MAPQCFPKRGAGARSGPYARGMLSALQRCTDDRVPARQVVAQDEVEHAPRQALAAVEAALPPGVPLQRWRLAIWAGQEGLFPEENFRRFKEGRGAAIRK